MRVLNVRNVCEALPAGLRLLLTEGRQEESRAGDVIVMPCPVVTVTRRPLERVLFSSVRDANPFFHLIEALWMLAGRDDAQYLDQYVGDFSSRFAEMGGTLHGAYGYRWRSAFGFDQLNTVVEKLRANPADRQAVIQMWDAAAGHEIVQSSSVIEGVGDSLDGLPIITGRDDLRGYWKDRPCNTHIYLRVRMTREPVLDLTVCCRSNDMLWGAHGANAVHFSVLQEYLAARIGVGVGTMYQLSNNYHIYTRELDRMTGRSASRELLLVMLTRDAYSAASPPPVLSLMTTEHDQFMRELSDVLDWCPDSARPVLYNPLLRVAARMRSAHNLYKLGCVEEAQAELLGDPCDWAVAAGEWVGTRAALRGTGGSLRV